MSDGEQQLFIEKVDNFKKQLISGKEADENGRYAIDSDELVECIFLIVLEYRNYIQRNKTIKDGSSIDQLFYFSNLDSEINWHQLIDKLNPHFRGLKFSESAKNAYILCDFIFENCSFRKVRLANRILYLFSKFNFKNCDISVLECTNSFFVKHHFSAIIFYRCSISNTVFEGSHGYQSSIYFEDCNFIWKLIAENVSFEYLNFKSCTFCDETSKISDSEIPNGFVIFNNTNFHDTTCFEGCNFHVSPKFHGTKFHSDTSFQKSKFLDIKSPEAIGDYRVLKQAMHDLGAEHDAMNFHALELDARRKTVLPSLLKFNHPEWTASVSSWFLKITNDYGRNYWLPFLWLFVVTGFFSFLYFGFGLIGCDYYNFNNAELWQRKMCDFSNLQKFKISWTYSLQKSLGPISLFIDSGVLDAKTGWGKIVSVLQVMLSSIYWFIIIIQLRRQFKL